MDYLQVYNFLRQRATYKFSITRYGHSSDLFSIPVGDTFTLISFCYYYNKKGNISVGGSVLCGQSQEQIDDLKRSYQKLNGGLAFGLQWKIQKSGATLSQYRDTRGVSGIQNIVSHGGDMNYFYALSPRSTQAKRAAEFSAMAEARKMARK